MLEKGAPGFGLQMKGSSSNLWYVVNKKSHAKWPTHSFSSSCNIVEYFLVNTWSKYGNMENDEARCSKLDNTPLHWIHTLGELVQIRSGNDLLPTRHQALAWSK